MNDATFCAIILTHGRAGRVVTDKTLRRHGYTGRIVYLVDDEDEQLEDYRRVYGAENVKVFCKQRYIDSSDTMMQKHVAKRGVVLYARNAAFDVARSVGATHFVELDDDYTVFERRWIENGKLKARRVEDLDEVFTAMVRFVNATGAVLSLAQGGDLVGGVMGQVSKNAWKRKAMNSFVFKTDDKRRFAGAVNEDVVTYLRLGRRGDVVCQALMVALVQKRTQSSVGGMTGEYLDDGTYVKSMFSVVESPSCVKVAMLGHGKSKRLHHRIEWRYAVPKILREQTSQGVAKWR